MAPKDDDWLMKVVVLSHPSRIRCVYDWSHLDPMY